MKTERKAQVWSCPALALPSLPGSQCGPRRQQEEGQIPCPEGLGSTMEPGGKWT